MQRYLTDYSDSASGWERALMAFVAEKQRRSGSERTTQSYSRMLQDFFGRLAKAPDTRAGLPFSLSTGRSPEPASRGLG